MGETVWYKVKNWEEYQHYRDRNPPWIKLYGRILTSKDWVVLSDESRLHMVVCMVLASDNFGYIPDDPAFIQRRAYLSKPPDLKPLIESGFLESAPNASKMLADASKMLSQRQRQIRESKSGIEDIKSNTSNNSRPKPRKKFEPPDASEVIAHMLEKGVKDQVALREGQKFMAFYESKGWKVGKETMISWKSAASGWVVRNNLDTSMKAKWEAEDALKRAKELTDVPF